MAEKSKPAAFIHSTLDDYGLTPTQFRLVCHIARRGKCFEGIPKIAKHCQMHAETVRNGLKLLRQCNLIFAEPRKGQTTVYKMNPIELWNPSENKVGVTHRKMREGGTRKIRETHPSENKVDKVYPSEGNPNKDIPSTFSKSSYGRDF